MSGVPTATALQRSSIKDCGGEVASQTPSTAGMVTAAACWEAGTFAVGFLKNATVLHVSGLWSDPGHWQGEMWSMEAVLETSLPI